jgi:hypothetical protein
VVGNSSGFYKAGWFSDWKLTGLIGVAIVCSIIALAAMLGIAFNLPTIKAFANNELKQAVISALIIFSLLGLVTFFDAIARDAVEGADLPIVCLPSEPCYITAAKNYLTTLQDTAKTYAEERLKESITISKHASKGWNLTLNKIYLLFAGMSTRFNAGDSINAERHGAMFSQVSRILTSLYVQKYFLDIVTYGVAPLFILLGVVLRTFFFTRRLGGLLLAIAIALFIIYPLTFVFAWYTLNVTVYGERTLAVADPNCPGECTSTYPVAFFTNDNGEIVQFPTTQSIMRAGITSNNWNTGGPDNNYDGIPGDFHGLTACRDLTSANLGSAPNACPDCPDYCRDVPFPSNMPGCNITKCSACNPGCKLARQRLTCNTDPACAGNCPDYCRTRVPLENKCFDDEKGGVIPANLSVSCEGCGKYPHWCRFLKNESGTFIPVYNDSACIFDETTNISNDPSCPHQCSYVTQIGGETACDRICSWKSNGQTTICPLECRVSNLLNNATWAARYDIAPPNLTEQCSSTPEMQSACNRCRDTPACLITVPDDPPPICADYPNYGGPSELCLDCPEYCRLFTYPFFHNGQGSYYSNVERNSYGLPDVCNPQIVQSINCSGVLTGAGNPPACNISCVIFGSPPICRTLNMADPDPLNCRHCPEIARFDVRYSDSGITTTTGLNLDAQYDCSSPTCPSLSSYECKGPTVELPNTSISPACADEDITGCSYGCRVTGPGIEPYLDFDCFMISFFKPPAPPIGCPILKADHPECFVSIANPTAPICSEYLGNGPASCHGKVCTSLSEEFCEVEGNGCYWDTNFNYCESTTCPGIGNPADCNLDCEWMTTHDIIRIENRAMPYADRSDCRQCPEQCRIKGYTRNCGVRNNAGDAFVDCSESSCPSACRTLNEPPSPTSTPPHPECKPFEEQDAYSCEGCPVLCRRKFNIPPIEGCELYPNCLASEDPSRGCSDACRLDSPPDKVCEACFSCDMDCLYYPSIRTDCSDICSDAALAGPVNIGPNDFIKSLPGAKTYYTEVRDIGVLFVPGMVLPLFCIVIVISFVRILSPVLGGDIEIPGLGRII